MGNPVTTGKPVRVKTEWRRALAHTTVTIIMIGHHVVVLGAYAGAVGLVDSFRKGMAPGPGKAAMLLAEIWFGFVFLHRLWLEWVTREKWGKV
jgi:hypothetical protein